MHTNHFVDPGDGRSRPLDLAGHPPARRRGRPPCSTRGCARGDDPHDLLRTILSDHDGVDEAMSICGHPDLSVPVGERDMTTASMIWDPQELSVDVCAGPPCENERRLFSLR